MWTKLRYGHLFGDDAGRVGDGQIGVVTKSGCHIRHDIDDSPCTVVTVKGIYFPSDSIVAMKSGNKECERNDVYAAMCPCRDMLDLLANKWSALAIGALEEGPQRFGQLQRRLQGVSPKVLSQTLKRLEEYRFLTRTVFPEVPPRVEYELTDLGYGANEPLKHLRDWVEETSLGAVSDRTGA